MMYKQLRYINGYKFIWSVTCYLRGSKSFFFSVKNLGLFFTGGSGSAGSIGLIVCGVTLQKPFNETCEEMTSDNSYIVD